MVHMVGSQNSGPSLGTLNSSLRREPISEKWPYNRDYISLGVSEPFCKVHVGPQGRSCRQPWRQKRGALQYSGLLQLAQTH